MKNKTVKVFLSCASILILISSCSSGNGSSSEESFNPNGKIAIEPQFNAVNNFSDGLATVFVGNGPDTDKVGFIDKSGKYVINPKFEWAGSFVDGLAPASNGKSVGYINKLGEWEIQPQFDEAYDFNEGLAVVCYSAGEFKCGYIDKKGTVKGPLDVESPDLIESFTDGTGLACFGSIDDCLYGYLDKEGKFLIRPQYEVAGIFSDGLAPVRIQKKYGFINKKNEVVINPQFDWVGSFNSGLAPVALGDSEENLKIGFVDIKGNYIVNPTYDYFNFWDNEDNWGNYAKEGFSDGLARIKSQGKIGFINTDGKIELEPQFEYAGNFVSNISRFSINDKYGFINKKGQIVVNPKYDSAYNYYDGLAAIKVGEVWGFVS